MILQTESEQNPAPARIMKATENLMDDLQTCSLIIIQAGTVADKFFNNILAVTICNNNPIKKTKLNRHMVAIVERRRNGMRDRTDNKYSNKDTVTSFSEGN